FKALLASSEFQDRFVNLRIADFNGQALERDAVNRGRRNRRQDFEVEISCCDFPQKLQYRVLLLSVPLNLVISWYPIPRPKGWGIRRP
ncbi:MAG: hypothetical protein ACEQR8_08985, partial [Cypionkella sp.]